MRTSSSSASATTVERLPRRYLRPPDAAEYLGVSPKFLAHARIRGDGPPFIRASGRLILYAVADLDQWLGARRRTSTSDQGQGAE
ncbi:MAG TPA: helix-turn-helix domain-containing protein [Terriglobia bacterium]|nr:helix-turn-helix domain-containing protein [Terriglobia bacterium]